MVAHPERKAQTASRMKNLMNNPVKWLEDGAASWAARHAAMLWSFMQCRQDECYFVSGAMSRIA
jgi:hypothetical protein